MATPPILAISPQTARRLAVAAQQLTVDRPADNILDIVRALGCLQIDPTNAVARTHQLVLWSRLGAYDEAEFERLMWQERSLFEYWAHAASIVLTEDFPIHAAMMRREASLSRSWGESIDTWLEKNAELRDHILGEIRERGPLASRDFEDKSVEGWQSTGWNGGRNVGRMIDFLWTRGQLMVVGRPGNQKLWDLTERWLPDDITALDHLRGDELTYEAAQKALRTMGSGTAKQIPQQYTRLRYPNLKAVLPKLIADSKVVPVKVEGWKDEWLIHTDLLPLLDRIEAGEWAPRTVLLSPFDNLIADRKRTRQLFDFDFKLEIYVPKEKRQYGFYVLPILHGDRLIGRVDSQVNRKTQTYEVNAVFAEPDAPKDAKTAKAIAATIQNLASFTGAKAVTYTDRIPNIWAKALRST
jgi:uncharacterized protein YcaQ